MSIALVAIVMIPVSLPFLWLIFGFIYGSKRVISPRLSSIEGRKMKVTFLHPDLGIGGAENLIVNCAVALQKKGYEVHIFTSHHDINHCFHETKDNGPLAKSIIVYGDFLPRTIFGRFYAFCAFLRMIYISFRLYIEKWETDVFFLDQVSLPIPLLRAYFGKPVYFYGHYPDKLLSTDRKSILKQLYRIPLDMAEEATTRAADTMVVNSKYTSSVFQEAFPSLSKNQLSILYPPVDIPTFARPPSFRPPSDDSPEAIALRKALSYPALFVSLNRYERKKNIALAIEAYVWLRDHVSPEVFATTHLVISGGYDKLNIENVQHFDELQNLVHEHKLTQQVTFLKSIRESTKQALLWQARAVLYTPSFEHFGIVPVEAMASGTPVVAVNSGGPLESISHDVTGYLCDPVAPTFGYAMVELTTNMSKAIEMGKNGIQRACDYFSMDVFGDTLDQDMRRLILMKNE